MNLGVFGYKLSRHICDIACGGLMPIGIKPAAVDKVGVAHAQTRGTLVHLVDKCTLRATDVLRHGDTCVVCTCDCDTFNHRLDGLRLAGLEKYLASAHARRVLGHGDGLVERDFSVCEGVKNQYQSHYLGYARRS